MCNPNGWLVHLCYLAIHVVTLAAEESLTFLLLVLIILQYITLIMVFWDVVPCVVAR